MVIEDIKESIEILVRYLRNDSERFCRTTNTRFQIFRNAVNSGGYEKYLQAVYAAVKQAYLNTDVYMEFPITAHSRGASGYCDIAYMRGDYYFVEELKCYTKTMRGGYFYNQYKKDIRKVAKLQDYNRVEFGVGYAIGFIVFSPDEDVIRYRDNVIRATNSFIRTSNIDGRVYDTPTYEVDGLYLCAVITRAYSKNPFIL